jgi:hypothetical protein
MGLLGWNRNPSAAKDPRKRPTLDEMDTSSPLRDLLFFDFDVLPVVFLEFDGEKTIVAVEQSNGTINPLEFSLTPKQQHDLANEYIDWKARQKT